MEFHIIEELKVGKMSSIYETVPNLINKENSYPVLSKNDSKANKNSLVQPNGII